MPAKGYTDCPLCGTQFENGGLIPSHIRHRCDVAKAIRVEEMDLPEEGYDRGPPAVPDNSMVRDESGQFVGGETA